MIPDPALQAHFSLESHPPFRLISRWTRLLLALSRSSAYHQPAPVSEQDLEAMRLLDEAHLQFPFYGSRRLSDWLGERGVKANRRRVRRLMGLEALYPAQGRGRGHQHFSLDSRPPFRLISRWTSWGYALVSDTGNIRGVIGRSAKQIPLTWHSRRGARAPKGPASRNQNWSANNSSSWRRFHG